MSATGTATIDFGAAPGSNEASIVFSDAAVTGTSKADAFFMAGDTTADHTANDHKYAGLFMALSVDVTNGVGGTIYAQSPHKMTGTFKVRWVWTA